MEDLVYLDTARFFDSTIKHYLNGNFDAREHILIVDYLRVPVQVFAWTLKMFLTHFWMPKEELDVHHQRVKNAATESIIVAQLFGLGPTVVRKLKVVPLGHGVIKRLPVGHENRLPRAPVYLGNPAYRPLAKPRFDVVDYLLSYCGESFEEFWTKDVDRITLDIFLDKDPNGQGKRHQEEQRLSLLQYDRISTERFLNLGLPMRMVCV